MEARTNITTALLWLSVIVWSIWVGGTIYQMIVIVPIWGDSLPESLHSFFSQTSYNQNVLNFFGPKWVPIRYVTLYLLLIAGWPFSAHRPLFITAVVTMTVGLIFTFAYVYPMNAVLFTQAGGNLPPDALRALLHRWIIADRARFAFMSIGYLALLRALSLPLLRAASS
jgi:hypothetical protein